MQDFLGLPGEKETRRFPETVNVTLSIHFLGVVNFAHLFPSFYRMATKRHYSFHITPVFGRVRFFRGPVSRCNSSRSTLITRQICGY